LNLKTPTVYDIVDKKPAVNTQATEAAREKQERIKERFKEWVWSDDSRRERLCRLYNDTFNHTRVRTFNGDHLTLPGASGAIQLHGHQKAGVWRILQTPNTLLAHVVGAGKTYTMVAAAMELKRLGLSRKPMFVVPKRIVVGDVFQAVPVRVQAQAHDPQHQDLPQIHAGAAGGLFARQHGGFQQGENLGSQRGMHPEPLQPGQDRR
jgi:N12 class adenine-specific DNA methylase